MLNNKFVTYFIILSFACEMCSGPHRPYLCLFLSGHEGPNLHIQVSLLSRRISFERLTGPKVKEIEVEEEEETRP